ncbi:MAG: HDIG domain-containing protein, partial [Clostridia bacterium]|nr:HDIG domain-containing protein [Clostridia bacterium]
MVGAHQSRLYHLEDVWEHTMMVIDLAAGVKDQASDPARFMLAALLHDTGKAITEESHIDAATGEVVYNNIGHPAAGAYVAETVLRRFTDDRE